jgi:hypothetical protein
MYTAKTPKAIRGNARALQIRKFDSPCISDDHVFDIAFPVYQYADLPIGFEGQLAKLPRKLGRDDLVWRDATGIELLDTPQLVRF